MAHRRCFLNLILATAAATSFVGCTSSEVAGPDMKAAATDASSPLIKGGEEQPPVKVKGKTVSAREAAGIGR
ncbi:hypothetical protein [Paludisphaera rhizosphaerae]|uniref:hypothetical protein n=1 Tax=Paludisphaera rhizosphaerae TaxID=2711216 RepID=UPI0013EB2A04|nr:hypothetical protein [Paludisphaera rhizosphaerae]